MQTKLMTVRGITHVLSTAWPADAGSAGPRAPVGRESAERLVSRLRGQPSRGKHVNVKQQLRKFRRFVESTLAEWTEEERQWAVASSSRKISRPEPDLEVLTKEVFEFWFQDFHSKSAQLITSRIMPHHKTLNPPTL